VISNSSARFLGAQLECTGIDSFFSAKVADAQPKPDPEGLLRACRQLGVKPAEAVFVGDSRFDEQAGQNAGIRTLIVGRDINDLGEIVAKLSSLPERLEIPRFAPELVKKKDLRSHS